MAEQSNFTVRQILETSDRFDVPEGQREFVADSGWCAWLIDSLHDAIPIGSVLAYEPDTAAYRPVSRYRQYSEATTWFINGQQRITGIYAAFGLRPPWIPPAVWAGLGGPDREVAACLRPEGTFEFRKHRPSKPRCFRLHDLLEASRSNRVRELVVRAGLEHPDHFVEHVVAMTERLLTARINVEWLHGDAEKAIKAFVRHNQPVAARHSSLEECRLSALSLYPQCRGLQREVIDPAVREIEAAGFASSLGRGRIVAVMDRLLPGTVRARRRAIDPAAAHGAAVTAAEACRTSARYLIEAGISGDEVLSPPRAAETIAVLFARFPDQAPCDGFTRRWLVHTTARGRYHDPASGDTALRGDIHAVLAAASYAEAAAALARRVGPSEIPAWSTEAMGRACSLGRRTWARPGALYALACREAVVGVVSDLAEPSVRCEDSRLRLRPLWPDHPAARRTIAGYAWMTLGTAAVIAQAGGWNRAAYEALDCPHAALAAQGIAVPGANIDVEHELTERTAALARIVNTLLERVGPLDATVRVKRAIFAQAAA